VRGALRSQVAKLIIYERRKRLTRRDSMQRLKALADDVSFREMRQIVERDATLKMILLLPESVLEQALAVGKALQACAEHRRSSLEDREEGYRK
jgi:hypothetical protein